MIAIDREKTQPMPMAHNEINFYYSEMQFVYSIHHTAYIHVTFYYYNGSFSFIISYIEILLIDLCEIHTIILEFGQWAMSMFNVYIQITCASTVCVRYDHCANDHYLTLFITNFFLIIILDFDFSSVQFFNWNKKKKNKRIMRPNQTNSKNKIHCSRKINKLIHLRKFTAYVFKQDIISELQ